MRLIQAFILVALLLPGAGLVAQDRSRDDGQTADAGQSTRSSSRSSYAQMPRTEIELGGRKLSILYHSLATSSDDYPQLQKVKEGEVLRLTRSAAWKLRTEVDLIVGGELRLDTENVAANYPGVYSLWLKKTTNGWNLVANSEPDIWATMHNPEADVGEIALTVGKPAESASELIIELAEANGSASFRIAWGDTEWRTTVEEVKE